MRRAVIVCLLSLPLSALAGGGSGFDPMDGYRGSEQFAPRVLTRWDAADVARRSRLLVNGVRLETAEVLTPGWSSSCIGTTDPEVVFACTAADCGDWDESGDWLTVRLTPDHYPFAVEGVSYYLWDGTFGTFDLDAELSHGFRVWIDSDTKPDGAPKGDHETVDAFDPPAPGWNLASTTLQVDDRATQLEERLVLEQGESLFVAVQMEVAPDGSRGAVPLCPSTDPWWWYFNGTGSWATGTELTWGGYAPTIWAWGWNLYL